MQANWEEQQERAGEQVIHQAIVGEQLITWTMHICQIAFNLVSLLLANPDYDAGLDF